MGPVSSSCFWQDGQGGPGEAEGQPPIQEGKLKEVIKQLGIKKSFIFSPLPLTLFSSCLIPYPPPPIHSLTLTRVVGLGSKVTSWRELLLFRVGLQ